MSDTSALTDGFRKFREIYFEKSPELFRETLRYGQNPQFAMVACSDSRVDPAIVFQTHPGDIFSIRNVAALVPPNEQQGHYHGTSAALEFAVTGLKVEHIVIMGHAHCGGVEAMVKRQEGEAVGGQFLSHWTDLLIKARERALAEDDSLEGRALLRAAERQGVKLSLENLMTFPFVSEAVGKGRLQLHGWYLDIAEGQLEYYDTDKRVFQPLT
ncbi:MAG: carbonic anhydrase [Alphaproteobacteria bacterium]|nr:MAG: carbonic anhydrase [Alphaproteobacteria bacterium]